MIVDTSALIAIIAQEPEGETFLLRIKDEGLARMSAVTAFEFGLVADRWRSEAISFAADQLLRDIRAEIVPVDADMAQAARTAYRRFGKGHHPARLNFGDCFSYALAKERGEPLLFKGADFAQTDVEPAV